MIDKISVSRRQYAPKKDNNNPQKQQPAFKGMGDLLIRGVQACEREPMWNVTFLDLSTAILPRTFFETFIGSKKKDENGKETHERQLNIMGGFEAFRRESSGLLINCIIPSFIVAGAASLLQKPIMGDFIKNKAGLSWCWANGDSLSKIEKFYKESTGATKEERVFNTLKNTFDNISGVAGNIDNGGEKVFKDVLANDDEYINTLKSWAKNLVAEKPDKKLNKTFYETIVNKTGVSENIKFNGDKGYFSNNLKSLCDSLSDVLHNVNKIDLDDAHISDYFSKARKLVNWKSAAGLGVIIPLAIAAQPINRWITHKLSGKKGAPIYNDDKERVLTPDEKRKLTAQKFFAVPLMAGVAGLSMWMDRPSLKMFQFKNIFPTMDQARIISAATFSSRIAAAEDSNELKENTIRDIATFSSFYFLGDYAAKAIATYLDKHHEGSQLLTHLKNSDKNDNVFKKLWNWAKHTSIKSTDEIMAIKDEALRNKNKKLRTICQLGNIAFSLLSLGIFIPVYTRTQVNKKEREKLEALKNAQAPNNGVPAQTGSSDTAPAVTQARFQKTPPFQAFFNS